MQKKAARRGQRALAFLLCLLMVATLLPVMGASAAEGVQPGGGNTETNPVLTKNLYLVSDGTYTIRLEAYATGTTTTVTQMSGVPLDIVLVLDQSGSMSTSNYVEPLKTAVMAFVNNISKNANEYNVDHRIAIVGYASRYDSNSKWVNTGLFINGSLYNYQEPGSSTQTSRLTEQNYKNALVSVNGNDGNVATSITNAISKINGNGATYTNYGMEMANGVFENNPIEAGSARKRIVVVFTDGQPGKNGYDETVANAALSKAYTTKNTYGATVYTVGLYSNASTDVTNFMNYLSSNYPEARSMSGSTEYTYTVVDPSTLDTSETYYVLRNKNYRAVTYYTGRWESGWYDEYGWSYDPYTTNFYTRTATSTGGPGSKAADKYYMTTSNSNELGNIFENISQDIQHPSTNVTLNENSVLRDVITSGFDLPDNFTTGAVSVSTQAGSTNSAGTITWGSTTANPAGITVTANADLKSIAVTGFNYSDKYITQGHDGEKLIVKISGLLPNTSSDKLYSNEEISGIYQTAVTSETPFLFPMPYTSVGLENRVVDFGMTVNIGDHVLNTNAATNQYGTFELNGLNGKDYTYKLKPVKGDNGNYTFGFTGVDSSLYFADARWTKVNVIPANNVYYDDAYLNGGDTGSSTFTDGQYGYEAAVETATNAANFKPEGSTTSYTAKQTFSFTGSRIDLYCTTTNNSNAVVAALWKAEDFGTDGKQPVASKYMINTYESGTLYNVPTLSFDTRVRGNYVLVLYTNGTSNYQFDGVRVYNPADETNDTVKGAYTAENEANAQFLKVRDLLVQAGNLGNPGVVYTDEQDNVIAPATYYDIGPKNEVYLAAKNGVSFKLDGYNAAAYKVMVGLSAPEGNGNGQVTVTYGDKATTVDVKSVNDMYYEVTPDANGNVSIVNSGNVLVSVTNIKVTARNTASAASTASVVVDEDLLNYVSTFSTLSVVDTTTPDTPDPIPDTPVQNDSISAIIHAIWAQVKDSIDRLFGRL